MKTWVRKTLSVGVLAAGALLFAPGAANADVRQSTGDNNGILNGTQLVAPISVPVNIVGNSLGILGEANASGAGVNRTEGGRAKQSTGDNNGILNGTQAYLPISVPLNVVGNAAAVLGEANATGVGVNGSHRGRNTESAHTTEGFWGGQSTGDNNGILNGTQIYAPIDVPINVCGNALALLGGAQASAICANDVSGGSHFRPNRHHHDESAQAAGGFRQSTGDNNGILNGTQLYAPVSLPVNLAGNSLAILGGANSRAVAVNESARGGWGGQSTGDNNGILNGTQIAAPISLPINICGNALGVLGQANAAAGCANGADLFGDDDWNQGGHGHGHGQGHGHGNGGQNGGANGHNDGDYMGDNGNQGAANGGYGDDQGAGNGDSGYGDDQGAGNGNGDSGYQGAGNGNGSDSDSHGGRGKSTEASPVSNLTETVGGVGSTTGLGGLGLLSTLG